MITGCLWAGIEPSGVFLDLFSWPMTFDLLPADAEWFSAADVSCVR